MSQKKSKFLCWLDEKRLGKDEKIAAFVSRLPKWVTPNKVTWLRVLLLLVWLPWLIINPTWQQILIFFLPFNLLDMLDGAVARSRKLETRGGAYFDFVVDRVGMAMMIWVVLRYICLWTLVIWIILEIFVVLILVIDYFKKKPWVGQSRFLVFYGPPFIIIFILFLVEFMLYIFTNIN